MSSPEQLEEIKSEFLAELKSHGEIPSEKPNGQKKVVVVGGFPGSGKTTAANKLKELVKGSVHIQSNDARVLLARNGLSYGDNVHRVIEVVAGELLSEGYSIVQDGMIIDPKEREISKSLAAKYGARISYVVIDSDPAMAEQWARDRYTDGKQSTFGDWRAKPEKFGGYIESMYTRKKKIDEELPNVPDVKVIANKSTKDEFENSVARYSSWL